MKPSAKVGAIFLILLFVILASRMFIVNHVKRFIPPQIEVAGVVSINICVLYRCGATFYMSDSTLSRLKEKGIAALAEARIPRGLETNYPSPYLPRVEGNSRDFARKRP